MHRALLIAGLAAVMAACAPDTPPPAAPQAEVGAGDFEAAITRLEQRDPASPEALNARLQYADFLAGGGDCTGRLDKAQAQLDAVAARPALSVLLPQGSAQLKSTAYKIHAARADCDASHRAGELRLALDAARAAAGLYRDALDYQSAAVMQFNVAATLHALDDSEAAKIALETAITMDRAYGFRDDAQDNTSLLLKWRGEDDSDAHVADLMKDFPAHTAEFKFDWSESDADVAIDARETNQIGQQTATSSGTIQLKRHVRQDSRSWKVSYDPAQPIISLGDWPAKSDIARRFTGYMLAIALLETPGFAVYRTGDFEGIRDPTQFSATVSAQASAQFGASEPQKSETTGASQALEQNLKQALQATYIQADAAQAYAVQTATWIGAKLQQGVWYQMSAPLSLPGMGMGQFLVTHDIEFSYTRAIACAPGGAGADCAEIVVHATPDPKDLKLARDLITRSLHLPNSDGLHYWSTIDMRLVVKPGTLAPYVSDMRRHWYVALDGGEDPVISSERVVTTTAYH